MKFWDYLSLFKFEGLSWRLINHLGGYGEGGGGEAGADVRIASGKWC